MIKKLKQKICGFNGHDYFGEKGENAGKVFTVRLVCSKCGYKTIWFNLSGFFNIIGNKP